MAIVLRVAAIFLLLSVVVVLSATETKIFFVLSEPIPTLTSPQPKEIKGIEETPAFENPQE